MAVAPPPKKSRAAMGLAGVSAIGVINALGAARLGNLIIQGPVNEVGGFAPGAGQGDLGDVHAVGNRSNRSPGTATLSVKVPD
jgi:hypothetical protein